MAIASLFFILLVSGVACGTSDSTDGVKQDTTSSLPLSDRVDKLERLLFEQDAELSLQRNLLRQYEKKLARQQDHERFRRNNLLRRQSDKLSQLESLLHVQGTKLFKLETMLRQRDDKLSSQESLLRDQDAKLSSLENVFRLQTAKLSTYETLLRQKNSKLSSQENLLLQQKEIIQPLKAINYQDRSDKARGVFFKHGKKSDVRNTSLQESSIKKGSSGISSVSHDVVSRSDDVGEFEAVVSQISTQVTEMSADIESLKNSNDQQDRDIEDAQTSTFVHWGSSRCNEPSQDVYSGVVGGTWYNHSGGATNFLCLSMSPVLSDHPIPLGRAYLYGTEYDTFDSHAGNNKDAVCAMCRSTYSTTIMIPGTNICSSGWHLQYSGFLMAGEYRHAAGSQYICVDSQFEGGSRGIVDDNESVLYYTVARCGTLPCAPYKDNKIVTCAVCSK